MRDARTGAGALGLRAASDHEQQASCEGAAIRRKPDPTTQRSARMPASARSCCDRICIPAEPLPPARRTSTWRWRQPDEGSHETGSAAGDFDSPRSFLEVRPGPIRLHAKAQRALDYRDTLDGESKGALPPKLRHFAVERDQVQGLGWRGAELPEQRGHLTPVIGAVIYDVLEHLEKRRCEWLAIEGLVFDDAA